MTTMGNCQFIGSMMDFVLRQQVNYIIVVIAVLVAAVVIVIIK
jgi:hypothetical protein